MKCKTAGMAQLGLSFILAALLVTKTISVFTACMAFAIALALLGAISRGFTRR